MDNDPQVTQLLREIRDQQRESLALQREHIAAFKAQMDRVRFLSYDLASPFEELIDDHAQIIDAIEAKDAAQAAQILETHVRQVMQTLPQVAQHYPDYFIE